MGGRTKVYFDGGCRPNPGAMEIAVVIGGKSMIVCDLGHGTSMDAEWRALIHALRLVHEHGLTDVVLLGDSVSVVDQANGRTRSRGGNTTHLAAFHALAVPGPPPPVRHVKRSQNLAGIALARLHKR